MDRYGRSTINTGIHDIQLTDLHLLQDSRESLASVYSNAGEINYGRIPVTGDIVFGLDYDHRHSVLKIDVRNCQNIAPVDTKHNRSDP